jgi:hypothetical protein
MTSRIANRQIDASGEEARKVIAATREQTETTVRLERERLLRELDALRKSLAVDLRLQIARAFEVYDDLRGLSSKPDGPINARMVESKSRMPAPIIFSANAGKIGLLEDDAMGVVIIYTTLEGARGRVDRLATNYRTPDDIDRAVVLSIAKVFLEACQHARGVLPRLRSACCGSHRFWRGETIRFRRNLLDRVRARHKLEERTGARVEGGGCPLRLRRDLARMNQLAPLSQAP